MNRERWTTYGGLAHWWAKLLMALLLAQAMAAGFDIKINLQDGSGVPLNGVGFRWLLCEDNTVQKPPGVAANDSISLVIHAEERGDLRPPVLDRARRGERQAVCAATRVAPGLGHRAHHRLGHDRGLRP